MSATDNAFIKAYTDSGHVFRPAARVMSRPEAKATAKPETAANATAGNETIDVAGDTATATSVAAQQKTKTASGGGNANPGAYRDVGGSGIRVDKPHSKLRPNLDTRGLVPHGEVQEATGDGKSITVFHSDPVQFQPQWEVDQFSWPTVCKKLHETAGGGLAEIVRPLISAAWQGKNVVAVTSFTRGEGASTLAMCLARMAASYRVPVAIMDGDIDQPSIATSLGIGFDRGWSDVGPDCPLEETCITSLSDHLVCVPMQRHARLVDDSTLESVAHDVVTRLSNEFELVVLDAGPIFTAAHRWFKHAGARQINGTLVVQDVRSTTQEQLVDVCSRLNQSGVENIAVVENFKNN